MNDGVDLIKGAALACGYFIVAPLLALLVRNKHSWQKVLFAAICFMTISGFLQPAEWGFTLGYQMEYRGHARGFHFYFNEIPALAIVLAAILGKETKFKLFPPGLILYVIYCLLSLLSIFNAPGQIYVWMAALKAFKVILIFLAACHFFVSEKDVQFFVRVMSWTMIWEMIVVLKMKYIDHLYQVWGTFEHQNALCMYASLVGLVLLAAGAGPPQPAANISLFGFLASAVVVECTLSRAGLVIFGIGVVLVMLLSIIDKVSKRRVTVLGVLTVIGILGLAIAFNTIVARFHDKYNADSNQTRHDLNAAARQMLHDYPMGIGWNNFALTINPPWHYGDVIDAYFKRMGETIDKKAKKGIVESHYFLLLSETGYQGYVSYLLFIAYFLWLNLRSAWHFRGKFLGAISFGIAAACGMNYLQSLFERVLTQPRNMMIWMVLLGLTARIEIVRRKGNKTPAKPRPAAKGLATVEGNVVLGSSR